MSNINVMRKNLGPVTAYKYAVQQGYTGTEQEFAALMASYASVAEDAAGSASSAATSADNAAQSASAAEAAEENVETTVLGISVLYSGLQHRNIYRGKKLGTSITEAQKTAIHDATFDDMYIGDYWTINNHKYIIADMNYWKGRYDKLTAGEGEDPILSVDKNHLVIIAMTGATAKMNDAASTDGAYLGSKMYTEYLTPTRDIIENDLGNLVTYHREIFSNSVNAETHMPNNHVWVDSYADLMNELMVYGSFVHSPTAPNTINHDHYTIDRDQLSLFRLNPNALGHTTIWLRDVVTYSSFAMVNTSGNAHYSYAQTPLGVYPVISLAP